MLKIQKCRKGILGVESAIILIAFVIVAAAFSFMVVNMGLFATQRGRDTINQGIQEASTPLMLDGSIMIKGNSDGNVTAIIIPLKTLGVKYVPMANENMFQWLMRPRWFPFEWRIIRHTRISTME